LEEVETLFSSAEAFYSVFFIENFVVMSQVEEVYNKQFSLYFSGPFFRKRIDKPRKCGDVVRK
jgi:hypothetical protein